MPRPVPRHFALSASAEPELGTRVRVSSPDGSAEFHRYSNYWREVKRGVYPPRVLVDSAVRTWRELLRLHPYGVTEVLPPEPEPEPEPPVIYELPAEPPRGSSVTAADGRVFTRTRDAGYWKCDTDLDSARWPDLLGRLGPLTAEVPPLDTAAYRVYWRERDSAVGVRRVATAAGPPGLTRAEALRSLHPRAEAATHRGLGDVLVLTRDTLLDDWRVLDA